MSIGPGFTTTEIGEFVHASRFRGQVWSGEVLKIEGELTEVEPGPEGTAVKAKITVTNEDGTDVQILAWATGVLPR